MAIKPLPVVQNYTVHQILIPSLHRKYRFRPFLVKENKMLMVAQASNDVTVMLDTLKAIVANCCVETEPLDVDKLVTFDFEYLLIKLRAISIDNRVEMNVTCSDPHDGFDEATRKTTVLLDLNSIEVVGLKDYSPKVVLDDDLVVIMKQPTIETITNIPSADDYQGNLAIVGAQIDKICTADEVFLGSDYTQEQLEQWLEMLTSDQLAKLQHYFDTIPYCRIKVEWTCPHCGTRNIRYLEGVSSFF